MENHMTDGKLYDYNLERKNIDEKINFSNIFNKKIARSLRLLQLGDELLFL